MAPAAFSDIAKAANDLLNRDFYHGSAASLEVKSKAPNGVTFAVKGRNAHEGPIGGNLEAKYADKLNGFTVTQGWSTSNALDTKLELDNNIAKGLKAEILNSYIPATNVNNVRLNLYFKQSNLTARAFFDLLKGPTATFDAVLGHEGFLVGAEGGYDVQKAAITRYSAAVAYSLPEYTAALTATNNLSVYSASYYHRVNPVVEAGAKATWDSKTGNTVGLEVASKYRLDPSSFAKVKVNERGIAALAYNVLLRPGVTLGLGASIDTQNMNQAAHKVGLSFTFEN
ncbi:Porin, eukaryotic type [Ascosphaera apis ARSEF 7405]|uniref:Mitochondrial outer membrane protein porin n=1 Tax=Ascosphaera apis ARSEF 7405 TaxID=392613 RepID=A0A167V6M5_9EURO|nr:Porin, eukaryotic type [Ascosphaera apis ARSEF 7405]